ncbi:DUF1272 domain-containing protein [Streptomyces sp. NPDC001732]
MPPQDAAARICSYECTFCVPCSDLMRNMRPNCGGELVARPRRAPAPATAWGTESGRPRAR